TDAQGNISNVRLTTDRSTISDDAIGGRAYYLGRAELEIPLGASVRELGIRPSIFMDVGALWGVRRPTLLDIPAGGCPAGTTLYQQQILSPFREVYLGDSPSPRLSIGFGVNWNSPFGPFRIDIARALLHQRGDDTKLFTFNVGTAF